jgi:hypothetical protein
MRKIYYVLLFLLASCSKKDITLPTEVSVAKTDTLPTQKIIEGYRVNSNARSLGTKYWKTGTGVQVDLIIQTFQKVLPYSQIALMYNHIQGGWGASTCGDFNNDGWIDVFTPGASDHASILARDRGVGFSFLLYNPATKTYTDTSLLNDRSIDAIPFIQKVVPVYLNSDNYVDLVLFPADDLKGSIRLVISDGQGRYDMTSIITNENDTYRGSKPTIFLSPGDIADLNGDKLPDMFLTANNFSYIFWGIPNYPYFSSDKHPTFVTDDEAFSYLQNNGFGESCANCSGAFGATIGDVNKDGWNDVIIQTTENSTEKPLAYYNKILINKGGGRFNESSVIKLPYYDRPSNAQFYMQNFDNIIDDVNGDGLNDIITVNAAPTTIINFFVYLQTKNGDFVIDNNTFVYNNNNTQKNNDTNDQLFYYDYNKDGLKDIGYVDGNNGSEYGPWNPTTKRGNHMYLKTVFIRTGNQFIEKSLYDYDPYAKSLLPILNSRFK